MSVINAAFFALGFIVGCGFAFAANCLIERAPEMPDQDETWRLIP